MSLEDIVNLNITRDSRSVSRAGFGTALILSDDATHSGVVATYSSIKAVEAAEGTSSATYKAAAKLFGQDLKVKQIKVGKRTTKVAQVVTFTVSDITDGNKTITINGVEFTYTASSNTADEIRDALVGLVNAGSEPVTAAPGGSGALTVTADVAGDSFTYLGDASVSAALTTPSNGVAEDLAAVRAADDDWYALVLTSRNKNDILNAAAYIETVRKIFVACSADADVITSVSTDVASILKSKSYDRTFYIYSGDQANYPDAGILGSRLPRDPGSQTWEYKNIAGVSPDDDLTDTEIGYLKTKNAGYYVTIGGVAILLNSKVSSGEWVDTIRFIDFLFARITEYVFALLVSSDKVEFEDSGVAKIETKLREALELGERVGGLAKDPKYTVSVPKVADVSSVDKQNRLLPDVSFQATLSGAIHITDISGVVSV